MNRHLGKHLSVDFNSGFLQSIHQSAVRNSVHSRARVDSRDPQFSVFSFLVLSSYIRRTQRSHDSRVRGSEHLALLSVITFCQL